MSRRISLRRLTCLLLMPPLVGSAAMLVESSPAAAKTRYVDQLKNGTFEGGRAGWEAGAAHVTFRIVRTKHQGRVAQLSRRRTGPVVLTDSKNAVRSLTAGQRFVASAAIRTNQPHQHGAILIRQTSPSGAVSTSTTRFTMSKSKWRHVSVAATAKTADASLDLKIVAWHLKPRHRVQIDKVRLVGAVPAPVQGQPTPPVTPVTPTPPVTTPTPSSEPSTSTPTPSEPAETTPTQTPVVNPTPSQAPVVNPTPSQAPVVTPTPTQTPVVTPTPTQTPVVDPPPTTPSDVGGRLSNNCTYSKRGIPSCGALFGAAYGSNTDPTAWETQMGHKLGVHRTYYGASSVSSAVATATKDLANHRVPWISFKLPYSWTDMANGKGDAWVTDLATRLSKLNGPVYVAFHHEPEGDGDITEWTRMQAHLAPLVRAKAPNVAYSIVLTGWNELYGSSEYRLDNLMPKNTKIDLLGFDVYDKFGAVKNGVEYTKHTDLLNDYYKKFQTWADAHEMAWGIAETGFTDKSAVDDPQWVAKTYNDLVKTGGVAFAYFNTTLNSIAPWALGTGTKQNLFTATLVTTPTI